MEWIKKQYRGTVVFYALWSAFCVYFIGTEHTTFWQEWALYMFRMYVIVTVYVIARILWVSIFKEKE